MSKKVCIYSGRNIELYREVKPNNKSDIDDNDIVLRIRDIDLAKGSKATNIEHHSSTTISYSDMDELAAAWCKMRDISVNKYTVEELLELNEDEMDRKLVSERERQEELEYDNIFEVIASDTDVAKAMKERANKFLKLRDAGQSLAKQATYLSNIESDEEHDAALALIEILIEDYDSNLLLIDAVSASIARYEKSEL